MSREQSLQLRRVKKQIRFTPYKKPPPAAEEAAVEINLSTLVQPSTSKQLFKQQPIIQGKDLLVPSVTPKEESLIENTISYWQTKYPNQKKIAIVPPRQNSQRSIALKVTQNSSESTSRSTYQIIPPAEQALAIKIPKKSDLKILVILDNGEQRLVAFNPKETCTVQELLNQMKIEVVADSKYECIERPSPEIHYLIKVNSSFFELSKINFIFIDWKICHERHL